jgi:hypothetical protein
MVFDNKIKGVVLYFWQKKKKKIIDSWVRILDHSAGSSDLNGLAPALPINSRKFKKTTFGLRNQQLLLYRVSGIELDKYVFLFITRSGSEILLEERAKLRED